MTPEDHYQEAERLLRWLDVTAEVDSREVACLIVAITTVAHALLANDEQMVRRACREAIDEMELRG